MDKKYYKGADFSFDNLAFMIIVLASFIFFILTIISLELSSILTTFLWLAFLVFLFIRQRKRDKESYIHITDNKVSKVVAGKEQESIAVDMIFDYYETPNRRTLTIVGKDASKTLTIERFYLIYEQDNIVKSLAKLNINENLSCNNENSYPSINSYKQDNQGDSVYIDHDFSSTILYPFLLLGFIYLSITIHPTMFLIVVVIFLATLRHFYSVHKIILTDSSLIEKSLLDTKITKYQDIQTLDVEYVGGRGVYQKYPIVKINSINFIGFRQDCEMNRKMYEDISERLEKFREKESD